MGLEPHFGGKLNRFPLEWGVWSMVFNRRESLGKGKLREAINKSYCYFR